MKPNNPGKNDVSLAPRQKRTPRVIVWLVGILAFILVLPIVLAAIGAVYHLLASALAARKYPPPGQLIEVNGVKMHLYCLGTGSPTVILDAANQGTVSNWAWIQPELARTTRVCAYDRAGNGWSEFNPVPQDTRLNAEALHMLLAKAGEQPPYVLVGHSFGGLFTCMYAELYPEEVAGMVFIEVTLPDALPALGLPDVMPNSPDAGMIDAAPLVSRIGLLQVMRFVRTDPDLPEPQRSALDAYLASTRWAQAIKQQYHLFPTLIAQVRALYNPGSLGDIPLAVVLGSEGDGKIEELQPLFTQQAALSARGKVTTVAGANHISLVDKQEYALQTAEIIRGVIEAARQ